MNRHGDLWGTTYPEPDAQIDAQYEAYCKGREGRPVDCHCTECDDFGPHETNGAKLDPQFSCRKCGTVNTLDAP